MSDNDCLPWCGQLNVTGQERGVGMLIKGSVFVLKDKLSGDERSFCCHERAFAWSGLKMDRVAEPPRGFYGEGLGPLLAKSQHEQALKADAERLAELRAEFAREVDHPTPPNSVTWCSNFRRLETLIAIYEECAARGRTFGGVG